MLLSRPPCPGKVNWINCESTIHLCGILCFGGCGLEDLDPRLAGSWSRWRLRSPRARCASKRHRPAGVPGPARRVRGARPWRHASNPSPAAAGWRQWHLDEVAVKIAGVKHWLWRAVDQDGFVLDVLVQSRRNKAAAERLLRKLVKKQMRPPRVMVTDKLPSYAAAKKAILPRVEHRQHRD
jgi:IS1 family transposase